MSETSGVGMPAMMRLNLFGRVVDDVFGMLPYLVGSATHNNQYRDVDVRLILDRGEIEHWCGVGQRHGWTHARWAGLCLAFSALGREMTGLPIDFQIQERKFANKTFEGTRIPLGMAIREAPNAPASPPSVPTPEVRE